jgi:hypothetical protein
MSVQQQMRFGDVADAHDFWKGKEWKTYAVDLIIGNGRKRKIIKTMYVRARSVEGAEKTAKYYDIRRSPPRPHYYPRLASPRELGCTRNSV